MPLLIILLSVCILLALSLKKINPFISLITVSVFAGLALGMNGEALVKSVEKGVGDTLGSLALILCLGAMLGKMLEMSGAIQQVSKTLIAKGGAKNIQWIVMLTGIIVGIPLFYGAGFVILVPLVFSIATALDVSILYVAVPMAASLSAMHGFLPPHPGPVALASIYNASLSKTLLYGFVIAIPAVIIAGPVFSRFVKNIKPVSITKNIIKEENSNPPLFSTSLFIALMPVLLIALAAVAGNLLSPNNFIFKILQFTGQPVFALFIAVIFAVYFLGIKRKYTIDEIMKWLASSIESIAMIMMIIAAGGAFKQVLTDSGAGKFITQSLSSANLSPLLLAWIIAAALRVTLGSATVAGITAAGIVVPLAAATHANPELMVLSTGAGSLFFSHVNDTGFWMFKEYFGLSIKQTFLSWTIMETIISLMGLAIVLLLNMVV